MNSNRTTRARMDDAPVRPQGEGLLRLDGNEGPAPPAELSRSLVALDPEDLRRYPDKSELEARLAELHGVDPEQVLVTTGGDGTIAAFAAAFVVPGRRFVHTAPTFAMIPACAELLGAALFPVEWSAGAFPRDPFAEAAAEPGAVAALVTPNNPTGGEAGIDDVLAVADACAPDPLLLDLAYVEFGANDPTAAALGRSNVVVLRTLSKALGLAGLRVGYALGPRDLIAAIRAVAPPYPCSSPALILARAAIDLELPTESAIRRIRAERERLRARLIAAGIDAPPSGGNFVGVRTPRATELFEALRARGVLVRRFEGRADLADLLRISVPVDDPGSARLAAALDSALGELSGARAGLEARS
ncbi:pyridoxal phosphate-dependent aminotransferase [Engelhardtia mirabilis]|uniref:Histidinol-phosphate aminotransferase n=1 Tax=Engelhardtia mirabilis TaxID=2528011 RepID=A0A518BI34_9BACT|nr:Histidinol-phosphate aminotransferase [Planctomycetes bacterium Pla133]QDV00951.1 Histidinol-phosphate aminotransferase [Planctomycetes bacterium Pla86]